MSNSEKLQMIANSEEKVFISQSEMGDFSHSQTWEIDGELITAKVSLL